MTTTEHGPRGDSRPAAPERRGGRPKARDLVMRTLYEAEITGDDPREVLSIAFGRLRLTEDGRTYAEALLTEASRHRRKIDGTITKHLENWDISRLGVIERAILRMAVAEIIYQRETPVQVILDEALRLGHRYGAAGASSLLNGVLDPIARGERKQETGAR